MNVANTDSKGSLRSPPSIPEAIERYLSGASLSPREMEAIFQQIVSGVLDDAQVAGFLVALRTRQPDSSLLAAMARILRLHRVAARTQVRPLIDTCGTGGDGSGSFNVSTAAALCVAACGGAVAKHGNRAVSSKAGSADVLEAVGLPVDLDPTAAARMIDAVGFGFLFAPRFHPGMKHVAGVRRSLGVKTVFNVLGPLSNPALAEYQLIGVFDPELTEPVAGALLELGSKGALVVHCEGLDEIGLHGVTHGHRVESGEVSPFRLDPNDAGVASAGLAAIRGGGVAENASILRRVLAGEEGPCRDIVALNAGAALWIAKLAPSLNDGVVAAKEALRSGAAKRVLDRAIETASRLQSEVIS